MAETQSEGRMSECRTLIRILIVASSVAAAGFVRAASGEGQQATPSATTNKSPTVAREFQDPLGNPPIARQFKGKLDPIGPFRWLDLAGRWRTERDFKGKILIVQQWAAWCGPCVEEFPQMQDLYDAVRHNPSIGFVSLNMDRNQATISEFLQEFRKEYSFPVLFAGEQLKIKSLPYTWIVDREGYIRDAFLASGPGLVDEVLALAEAVKHRPPVSDLPDETRRAIRERNERDGATSR